MLPVLLNMKEIETFLSMVPYHIYNSNFRLLAMTNEILMVSVLQNMNAACIIKVPVSAYNLKVLCRMQEINNILYLN